MKTKNIIVGFIAGILGALVIHFLLPNTVKEKYYVGGNNSAQLTSHHSILETTDFVNASEVSTTSVVYIKTKGLGNNNRNNWFDFYFNGRGSSVSSGSGVIFTKDGYIVTNNHVINDATEIEVIHNKRTYEAKVIGIDQSTDLAVLKIEAEGLPNIKIAKSSETKIGQWVLAVGNPFNLTSTVTAGIISAKGRIINIVESKFPIESFIQTDAAINPGNSGGALVNTSGELIGVNTAILSETGSYTGYGFAVPSDIVSKVVEDIINHGEVQKAYLGADIIELTSKIGDELELTHLNGVIINTIQSEGAADKSGLKVGDVILKINDVTIDNTGSFNEQISYSRPGDKIKITYAREKVEKTIEIILLNREGTKTFLKRELIESEKLGAIFEKISKIEKEKLGIDDGIKIYKITGSGLISRLGIKKDFIITHVNNVEIKSVDKLTEILETIRGKVVIQGITENGGKGYYSFYF